jgi:DNA uptake protein ComE-like DNA-binding protein
LQQTRLQNATLYVILACYGWGMFVNPPDTANHSKNGLWPKLKPPKTQLIKYLSWKNFFFFLLILLGLGAVTGGFYFLFLQTNQVCSSTEDFLLEKSAESNHNSTAVTASIYLAISGAVKNPGVYQLPDNSRLANLVQQAGGFSSQADQRFVSQELNLATALEDGQKFYIPSKQELEYQQELALVCQQYMTATSAMKTLNTSSSSQAGNDLTNSQAGDQSASQFNNQTSSQTTGSQAGTQATSQKTISINTASTQELESLPGIGKKRAASIIAQRPYQQLEELLTKKVLSEGVFNNLQGLISLYLMLFCKEISKGWRFW